MVWNNLYAKNDIPFPVLPSGYKMGQMSALTNPKNKLKRMSFPRHIIVQCSDLFWFHLVLIWFHHRYTIQREYFNFQWAKPSFV